MFKRKGYVVLLFFVFLTASALIANHFTGRVFNFHDSLDELKHIYISLESSTIEPPIAKIALNNAVSLKHTQTATNFHLSNADNTRCVDTSLGKIKYKHDGNIYTWTDEEGIPHFSDKKPNFAVATYNTGLVEPLDYFDLTLNTPQLPTLFKQQLRIKLNTVFKAYGQIIGVNNLKKVKLNLTVLPTRGAYEISIKQRGGDPTNSVGMYFHSSNSAFIEYRNAQSTMRTAVHEAVHAINNAVLGYTPRWLNEGFAEYFETTKNNLQTGIVEPNISWTANKKLSKNVFTINRLILLDESWQQNNINKLYASSWAAIYFLMDSSAGRLFLKNIMHAEQKLPCSKLSKKQLQKMLHLQFVNVDSVYAQWLKKPLRTHNF